MDHQELRRRFATLTTAHLTALIEGDPLSHAQMGRRRGSTRITQEGLVDLGDRPTHRAGPQDGPGLSERATQSWGALSAYDLMCRIRYDLMCRSVFGELSPFSP